MKKTVVKPNEVNTELKNEKLDYNELDYNNKDNKVAEQQSKTNVRKKLDENMLVPIASGVQGRLTYIDPRTGKVWKFERYGDEDVMELRELRTMLSSARKFLTRGWIRVLDDEVIEYLNLERFQQEVVTPEDLERLLTSEPEQILKVVKEANSNAKRLIYGFAKEKYVNGELTNIHIIRAIEDGLGESLDPNI